MPIAPRTGEDQSKWMSRCVPEMIGTGADKRPNEQAVAICLDIWREHHGGKKPPSKEMDELIARWKQILAPGPKKQADELDCPEPEDDESHADYMDRCVDEVSGDDVDEDDAREACEMKWEESRSARGFVEKTHADTVHGMEFILSDESPDRMGDVISSDGWTLDNFKRNPIALFNHLPSFPIGRWRNLRVGDGALRGHLEMAPAGTSARIDEIRKLIEAGILKAVSVGFRDLESEPLEKKDPFGGRRFLKQELVETSLVAVPANANALAIAKSLQISPETCDLVFAKHGNQDVIKRRGFTGKHADTSRNGKGTTMSLSQRISDIEAKLVELRDKLGDHWNRVDDSNVSDADLQVSTDLNADIMRLSKQHDALIESEKLLAKTSDGGNGHARPGKALVVATGTHERIAAPAIIKQRKELDPLDYLARACTVAVRAKSWGRLPDETRALIYGDDEETKTVCDLVLRAASAPAMTTVTGWAAELVQQKYTDLMPLLMPKAILTRLAAKGLSLSFGTTGRIIIPTRSRTPTIAGSFVGEGAAIPVRQGAFTSQTLVPKKLAVISTWTREMADHSTPAIEGLIREAIQDDSSVAVDTVLIDANAATAIRPPGLLNGVTVTTANATGGLAALVADIKALIGALTTSTYGNLRSPVWLLNPTDILSASLTQATNTGIFPFRDEIARGTLNTVPFIDSSTVPAKTMILVDAADFVLVGGEPPRMEISDQATLHTEDTNPLDLVSSGSPAVVAAPQRSLFQTDSLALRMVMPLNWVQRRTGTIAWTQAVTW
jgi:HK97 family phage major capsid protein/HK97 family phage prohead protease